MRKSKIDFTRRGMTSLLVLSIGMCVSNRTEAGPKSKGLRIVVEQPEIATNRPMRDRRDLVLTIGQTEGDLQGKDDKIIQAWVEYLNRMGGGMLHILPGTYHMRNAIYLRPDITLRGSGEKTVLRKGASVVTPLVREADWYEYGVQVESPKGFVPGGG